MMRTINFKISGNLTFKLKNGPKSTLDKIMTKFHFQEAVMLLKFIKILLSSMEEFLTSVKSLTICIFLT